MYVKNKTKLPLWCFVCLLSFVACKDEYTQQIFFSEEYQNELIPGEATVEYLEHHKPIESRDYEGIDTILLSKCVCNLHDQIKEIQISDFDGMTYRIVRVIFNDSDSSIEILVKGDFGKDWHAFTPEYYKLEYSTSGDNMIIGEIEFAGTKSSSFEFSMKGKFKCISDSAEVRKLEHVIYSPAG